MSSTAPTCRSIAEQAEREFSDSLADITMLQSLAASSPLWDTAVPPEAAAGPIYIHIADGWRGGLSRAQWKARLAGPESEGFRQLTRMWVVATFARWEGHYRGRMKAAGGVPEVDIFGDLCKLRNDIVHNDARALKAGRCVILTGHAPGSAIWFDSAELGVIMRALEDWVHGYGGHTQRDALPRGSTKS